MSSAVKKNHKRRCNRGCAVFIIILIVLAVTAALSFKEVRSILGSFFTVATPQDGQLPAGGSGNIEVHIIDVGQGDSILVVTSGGNMLIDAGPNSAEDNLKNYLTGNNISSFEYAVFTHPHEDHIGGADMIMTGFTVSNVILPGCTSSTQTYARMMDAIEKSGANVITAVAGSECVLGSVTASILAPVSETYSNINNYSVVIKLTYGETSFLLTGDAEKESEAEILAKFSANFLKCDVLKVGHHGSDTATTLAFLKAVAPKLAAISCGAGNSYGHPHGITLSRLSNEGVTVYRTDEHGTIVFISDGKKVFVKDD